MKRWARVETDRYVVRLEIDDCNKIKWCAPIVRRWFEGENFHDVMSKLGKDLSLISVHVYRIDDGKMDIPLDAFLDK